MKVTREGKLRDTPRWYYCAVIPIIFSSLDIAFYFSRGGCDKHNFWFSSQGLKNLVKEAHLNHHNNNLIHVKAKITITILLMVEDNHHHHCLTHTIKSTTRQVLNARLITLYIHLLPISLAAHYLSQFS